VHWMLRTSGSMFSVTLMTDLLQGRMR
jgi:hypothetical protein